MMSKVKNCCEFLSAKSGAVVVGPVNKIISFINLAFCMLYLFLFIMIDVWRLEHPQPEDIRFNFTLTNISLLIGIMSNILHYAFCIILKIGIKKRKSKLVRSYLMVGTVSAFLGVLSLALGALSSTTFLWSIVVLLVQVYFVVIVRNEYKNIRADGQSKNAKEYPAA